MQTQSSPLSRNPEFREISPKKKDRLTNEENPFLTIVQNSPLSTLILDEQSRILFANTAFVRFSGRPSDQLIGQEIGKVLQCGEFFKDDLPPSARKECASCSLCNLYEKTAETAYFEEDLQVRQLLGLQDKDIHLTAAPFIWGGHRFILLFIKDIKEIKRSASIEKFVDEDIQKNLLRIREWMNELDYPSGLDKEALSRRIRFTLNSMLRSIQTDQIIRKVESNQLAPEILPFSIESLFTDIHNNLEHLFEQRRCILSLSLPKDISQVETDRQLLEIILTHLVRIGLNSAKEGDTLHLGAEEKENSFDFYVNNLQFTPDNRQSHLDVPHSSSLAEGNTFGPYQIKRVVERSLCGKVLLESTKSGGANYRIRIPKTFHKATLE